MNCSRQSKLYYFKFSFTLSVTIYWYTVDACLECICHCLYIIPYYYLVRVIFSLWAKAFPLILLSYKRDEPEKIVPFWSYNIQLIMYTIQIFYSITPCYDRVSSCLYFQCYICIGYLKGIIYSLLSICTICTTTLIISYYYTQGHVDLLLSSN